MAKFTFISSIVFLAISASANGQSSHIKMAVIGDSTVTGAATNKHLKPYFANMLGFVLDVNLLHPEASLQASDYPSPDEFNIKDPIVPMKRVTYSRREYSEAKQKGYSYLFDLQGGSKLSRAFDLTENSFAYLISQSLNIPGDQVLMVAQDGKKVNTLSEQLERVMESEKTLPPLLLISYGLNDICHPDEVNGDIAEFKKRFKQTVREQLQAIAVQPPAAQGTTVLISAPLDATNLMNNSKLMSQRIPFEGAAIFDIPGINFVLGKDYGTVSCTELRDKSFKRQTVPGLALRNMLIGECKGLRSDTSDIESRVVKVRALQTAQIDAWKESLAEFSVPGITWLFGDSIREIQFVAGDLANDCFHPSPLAHAKIARQFLSHELKGYKAP